MENVVKSPIDNPPPLLPAFAVSVVIPMYNVDKYVGECLDSLLAQTFQDFDVIVVDDCSTDNSLEIVKSYESKFDGRLNIAQTEKNSGGAGEPRNIGIELSTGEYISFINPDDTIMPNTLAEMYKAAKKFDADVVHCEKWYNIPDEFYNDTEYRKNAKPTVYPSGERIFTTKPTLLTNDIEKRVKDFCQRLWLTWSTCLQMVRRDFILENDIRFPSIQTEDMIFTMCELCCAKNYLVLPNTFYFYRVRENSSVTEDKNLDAPKMIHKYALTLKNGINYLDKFLSAREFFSHRPDLKYIVFNAFMNETIQCLKKVYDESSPYDIDELLRKELDDNSAFTAFLFNNTYQLKSAVNQKRISVIIPMYNAEKYIGDCLDSLLDQTFQDFEVIVVDDCSTDNSIQVVNGYGARFNGRLKLIKTDKNTGSPGEPGNIGVALSRGEYLFIMDNDDAVTPDALEKLYTTAKKYDADVVTCEKFYQVPEKSWNDAEFRKNLEPTSYQKGGFVNEPTLVSFDIPQRVQDCYDHKFLWSLWQKLIRRDFLVENDICFTENIIQDMLATCCIVYTAKRLVRVPYVINFYRLREDSLYNQERKPLQQFETYMSSLKCGFKYLDEFLSKREFFKKFSEIKRMALSIYLREIWEMYVREIYHEVPASDRNKVLKELFTNDDQTILMEFFFYALEDFSKINAEAQIMHKLSRFFTGRVDFKFWSTEGDFQLLSVSDDRAEVLKPDWFQKGGIGYVIMSHTGKVEFVVKATANGRVNFEFRGVWVQDPEDKTKLIPYWIDYTKLIVNGQIIFDKITPAWHDQPYFYTMEAKANEEIKVQFEWLPHRGDILPEVSKTEEKPPVDKFPPYVTSRMDVKLQSTAGDFQILSMSDDNASVQKPTWLQKNGVGYQIQSYAGKMEFIAKATVDGKIVLNLLGMDVREPKDNSKRIPCWIDYTKLTINDKSIIDKITPVWHDKPYYHSIDAKAGEEIKIQVEWLPHRDNILPDKPVEKSLVDKFLPYVTSRMDVKLQSTAGDFQILSMSDDNAEVLKPTWLQKNGVGYQIQSYAGKMEFIAKATADGKINLNLLGMDVRDPKDNSKRIPYWIDYTKLTVNGQTVINKLTPAWHDKPYFHRIDAKANEEIKIQVEWLPHIGDTYKDILTESKIDQNKFTPMPLTENLTAISVIIPMYNAEKYIAEGLDSILNQTFQDFEVIVVDDCSTDNSFKVVQSYAEKFNGRLKLVSMEKNSGSESPPRNFGLSLARGEYVLFLDADDFILGNALETLYNAAKKYDAEVVYSSSYYNLKQPNDIYLQRDGRGIKLFKENLKDKPDFIVDDPNKLLRTLLMEEPGGNSYNAWTKFCRRNFLIENNIYFSYLKISPDFIWVINVYCHAKRFLRISTPFYFYRSYNTQSISHLKSRTTSEQISRWISSFVAWSQSLKELENSNEILSKNPAYCLVASKNHFGWCLGSIREEMDQLSDQEIYEILRREFSKRNDLSDSTTPFFMSLIYADRKNHERDTKEFRDFMNRFTGRVDFKFWSTEGDFELLSVSDDKAEVLKPDWFQNSGIGYVIMSHAGKIEFVAKATTNGRVSFDLRGIWVQDPEDNSKLIPYWIDYTKLTINGKTIFDKITPAWHDKPYVYTMDAKANEEIKVQFEWLPHRDDILPDKPVEKPPVDKFPPYVTSRMDVKLQSTAGDFQILSMSDDNASVQKPTWLQKNGIGYQIQSYAGKMEFIAKATAGGKINLNLLGMDVRDPKDNSKRVPNWIDYTKLTINGKSIIDKITPAWHDKPYNHSVDVKAGEEIKIQVEWLPHRGDILPDKPVEKPPVDKFPPYVTSRMDVKLQSTKGDFQILSVSDNQAEVIKPTWLQKGGVGYQIQSYAGKVEFIAKATADGKINLNLLGMDVRDPKDNSKRIPNWIDYTKLTVNGKTIIDKITPAWHDQPYVYTMYAKAGEEIKIQVEWLPHRDDILPDKPVEKPPVDKFPPYVTSRMDVKLQSTAGDFQILSMSDNQAEVIKPAWLQKGGVGYQIQSHAGKMEFVAKTTADGKVQLNLLGMDIRDPKDNSKRIPNWIDYTKLTINGKSIIDKITPAWHDKPYNHSIDAKADEEIKIQVEWLPHRSDT